MRTSTFNVRRNSQFGPCRTNAYKCASGQPLPFVMSAPFLNPVDPESPPSCPPMLSIQTSPPSSELEVGFRLTTLLPWTDRNPHPSSVHIASSSRFWSWVYDGSHDNVRCLLLENRRKWIVSNIFARVSASFPNVKSLEFRHLRPARFNKWSHSEGFLGNLTSLVIKISTVDLNDLYSFICTFPNLDNIELDTVLVQQEATITGPTITRKLQGKLTLQYIRCDHGPCITGLFARLPIAFKDISIVGCSFQSPEALSGLFAACAETVRRVKSIDVFFDQRSFR